MTIVGAVIVLVFGLVVLLVVDLVVLFIKVLVMCGDLWEMSGHAFEFFL